MAALRDRYTAGAVVLHWLIAVLLMTNIGLAWYFNSLHGAARVEPLALHKSIGITVLLLSLARLAWRLAVPPPELPSTMAVWERRLSRTVHVLFYVVMIGLPLTGWIFTSASPQIQTQPIVLFHLAPWPAIGPLASLPHDQMKVVHRLFSNAHSLLALLALVLIGLHVAGALKHMVIDRDGSVGRMIPFLRRGSAAEAA